MRSVYKIPEVSFFIEKIQKQEFFSFCKLNHAFWEAAIYYVAHTRRKEEIVPKKIPAAHPPGWFYLHGKHLMRELLVIIQNMPNTDIMLGASNLGPPDEVFSKKTLNYSVDPDKLLKFIFDKFPSSYLFLWSYLETICCTKKDGAFACRNM